MFARHECHSERSEESPGWRLVHSAPDLALREGHSPFFFYIFCKKYRKKPGGGRASAAPLTPLRMSQYCGLAEEVVLRVPGQISAAAAPMHIQRSGSGRGCRNSYDKHRVKPHLPHSSEGGGGMAWESHPRVLSSISYKKWTRKKATDFSGYIRYALSADTQSQLP